MGKVYSIQAPDGKIYDIESPDSPIVDFGKVASSASKAVFNPDSTNMAQGGFDIPQRMGQAALGELYGQTREALKRSVPQGTRSAIGTGLSSVVPILQPFRNMKNVTDEVGNQATGAGIDLGTMAAVGGAEMAGKAVGSIPIKGMTLAERTQLPIGKILASSEGQLAGKSNQISKNIKLTESLLRPEDQEFAKSIEEGTVYNPAEQAGKYIKKAKNMTEVTDQLRLAEGMPMEERALKYQSTKANPDSSHLNRLDELIGKERSLVDNPQVGSATSNSKLKQFSNIRDTENNNLSNFSDEQLKNPNFWQERKASYQKKANEAGAYTGNEKMSARAEAYKALAQGAQDKTYALDASIKGLNLENQGISVAKERASQLAAVERGGRPKSVSQEIVEDIRPTKSSVTAASLRTIGRKLFGNQVERITEGIDKSASKAMDYQKIIDLIDAIKAKRNPDVGVLEPILNNRHLLNAPKPKQLPSPEDFRARDIKAGKLLPGGQFGGKAIPLEGYSAIEMPETTESKLQELIKAMGVEQYAPPRSVTPQSEIPSNLTPDADGLIMSKKRRLAIGEILGRRKKNFPTK